MPKAILVLDDAAESLRELAAELQTHGYAVQVVRPGDDPVLRFSLAQPELVFVSLEAHEPEVVCDGIRSDPEGAIVPIVLVGKNHPQVRSASDALSKGADFFFEQPLTLSKVIAKVQTYIGPGGSQPSAAESPPSEEAGSEVDDEVTAPGITLPGVAGADAIPQPPKFDDWPAQASGSSKPQKARLDRASDELLALLDEQEAELSKAQQQAEAKTKAKAKEEAERKQRAQREAEQRAQKEIEEMGRREAAEKAQREAAEKAQREAAEKAQREAEEKAQREAAEKAQREAEEKAQREAEEKAQHEAAEKTQREAEEKAQREAEEKAQREIEELARREAGEKARREAEEKAQREIEELARREAGEKARREAEQKARRQAEEKARHEAEEKARREAEQSARRQAEEKARREAEENARREAEEQARREAAENARREAEEQARREAEEKARRQAAEQAQREAEEKARQKAQVQSRREAEEKLKKAQEQARKEAEERQRQAEQRQAELALQRRVEEEVRQRLEEEMRLRSVEPESKAADSGNGAMSHGAPGPTRPLKGSAGLVPLEPVDGNFGEGQDISLVLTAAWRQQITGRIDFTSQNRQKSLFFERGAPVDAYSSQVYDRMEEYLFREGKITRAQYQDVRVKGLRGPRRIGAYLVSEGYLKAHELFAAVRGHLEEVVYGVFEWEEGTYRYLPECVEEDDRVALDLDPRAIIAEGIRRKYLMPRLMKLLGGPSSLLALKNGGKVDGDALRLTPEERQVVRLVDGTRNIEDLVFSTGMEALRVFHVLAALLATGDAEVLVRGVLGMDEDGTSSADTIDKNRIGEKLQQVRQLDYFQVLGVGRQSTAYEIDKAFERNRHEFATDRFSSVVREQMRNELLEIGQVLEDARQVLRDQALRDAYARHLP